MKVLGQSQKDTNKNVINMAQCKENRNKKTNS